MKNLSTDHMKWKILQRQCQCNWESYISVTKRVTKQFKTQKMRCTNPMIHVTPGTLQSCVLWKSHVAWCMLKVALSSLSLSMMPVTGNCYLLRSNWRCLHHDFFYNRILLPNQVPALGLCCWVSSWVTSVPHLLTTSVVDTYKDQDDSKSLVTHTHSEITSTYPQTLGGQGSYLRSIWKTRWTISLHASCW